jgi:hypothetical protein
VAEELKEFIWTVNATITMSGTVKAKTLEEAEALVDEKVTWAPIDDSEAGVTWCDQDALEWDIEVRDQL